MARFLLLLIAICQYVVAQTNNTAAFVEPANFATGRTLAMRPVYQVGSTLDVKWDTTQTDYRIVLHHLTSTSPYRSTMGYTIYSE